MSVIVILLTVNCDHKSNGQRNQNPPWKGGPALTMRKQKARERLPNMSLPTRNQTGEHAPSFIAEMQPSVVWAQSAAYLPVSAKLNNMQKKLECKKLSLHLPQYQCCRSGASKKAGSQEIQTAELFKTCQDVIVPEGPAVRCSTYQKTL